MIHDTRRNSYDARYETRHSMHDIHDMRDSGYTMRGTTRESLKRVVQEDGRKVGWVADGGGGDKRAKRVNIGSGQCVHVLRVQPTTHIRNTTDTTHELKNDMRNMILTKMTG